MGAGQSKETIQVPANVAGSLNILVTQEVTERWQAIQRQKERSREKLLDFGGAGDAKSRSESGNGSDVNMISAPLAVSTFDKVSSSPLKEEATPVIAVDNKSIKREESVIEVKKAEREPLKVSTKPKEKLETGSTLPTLASSTVERSSSSVKKDFIEEGPVGSTTITPTNETPKMNKLLSHFMVQNDAMTMTQDANDIENGTVVGSPQYYKNGLPYLLPEQKQPFEAPAFQPENFQYEEVDETAAKEKEKSSSDSKIKIIPPPPPNFFDEEAMIGVGAEFFENEGKAFSQITSTSSTPNDREVRVPKVALPVIVDQDAKGKPVFETVASWRVRDNAEKQIDKNNEFWQNQLERIASKVEDDAWKEAQDVQRRIQDINARHPDIYSVAHQPGGHCNLLTTQIAMCYERNKGQVLKCNDLVRQFAKCANNAILKEYGNEVGR